MDVQFINDDAYLGIIKESGLPESEYTGNDAKFISIAKLESNTQREKMPEEFDNMFKNKSGSLNNIPAGSRQEGTARNGREINITFEDFVPPDILPDIEDTDVHRPSGYLFIVLVPYSLKDTFEITEDNKGMKGITFCSGNSSEAIKDIEMKILAEGVTDNYNLFNSQN